MVGWSSPLPPYPAPMVALLERAGDDGGPFEVVRVPAFPGGTDRTWTAYLVQQWRQLIPLGDRFWLQNWTWPMWRDGGGTLVTTVDGFGHVIPIARGWDWWEGPQTVLPPLYWELDRDDLVCWGSWPAALTARVEVALYLFGGAGAMPVP